MAEKPTYEALEKRVRELEETVREKNAILDSLPDHVTIQVPDHTIVWANAAACRSLGRDRAEILNRSCRDVWGMDEVICRDCAMTGSVENGMPGTMKKTTPDGRRWRIRFVPIRDVHGEVSRIVEIRTPNAKAAERALRASEEKFRKAFDTDIVAMAVSRRRDGMYLEANPGFQKLTGYAHHEIVGHTPLELGFYSREERAVLVRKTSEKGRLDKRELTFPTKNEGWKTILFSIAPIVLDNEDCFLATMVDITERKKAEEVLKKEGERLNDILQGTRAGTWEWFVQTGETRFNERWAEIVGYTLAELQPVTIRTWTDLCHPEDLKRAEALLQAHFSGDPDYYECEARMRHKRGHWVWVQDRGKVVEWTAEGKPRRMTGTHIDVTERKRLEAEHRALERRLQQIQKAESLARMAGAVAHHFNNMLAVILGNLELARDELSPEKKAIGYIAEADKAARRAADISRRMLTYLGQDHAPCHPLDLSAACRGGLASLRGEIRTGGRLKQDLPDPGPMITANAAQIEQVLDALVENAWEALAERPEGGMTVSVGAADAPDIGDEHRFPPDWNPSDRAYTRLMVADDGEGMEGETIGRIFDPFYTTKFTGRGMGLPAALGIVKAHGGCVTVESAPGRGSVFRVFLPLSPDPASPPKDKTQPQT